MFGYSHKVFGYSVGSESRELLPIGILLLMYIRTGLYLQLVRIHESRASQHLAQPLARLMPEPHVDWAACLCGKETMLVLHLLAPAAAPPSIFFQLRVVLLLYTL